MPFRCQSPADFRVRVRKVDFGVTPSFFDGFLDIVWPDNMGDCKDLTY